MVSNQTDTWLSIRFLDDSIWRPLKIRSDDNIEFHNEVFVKIHENCFFGSVFGNTLVLSDQEGDLDGEPFLQKRDWTEEDFLYLFRNTVWADRDLSWAASCWVTDWPAVICPGGRTLLYVLDCCAPATTAQQLWRRLWFITENCFMLYSLSKEQAKCFLLDQLG